jgi:phage/plasmid-associated DNA primase
MTARACRPGLAREKKHDGIRNDLARLKGCRFLAASETAEGRKLAEALVKDVTGGETISKAQVLVNGQALAVRVAAD